MSHHGMLHQTHLFVIGIGVVLSLFRHLGQAGRLGTINSDRIMVHSLLYILAFTHPVQAGTLTAHSTLSPLKHHSHLIHH